MSTTTLSKPAPAVSPPASRTEPESAPFPPSPELGGQLDRLAEAQAEVDRKKAEELARLRAIQDRD